VFRLLCTLEGRGYVARLENKRYRLTSRRRRIRLGYTAPCTGTAYRGELLAGLRRAAAAGNADLLELDNRKTTPKPPWRTCSGSSTAASIWLSCPAFRAHRPHGRRQVLRRLDSLHPIEVPIQGGVYFGANNFRAGRLAGQALGRFARMK